MSRLQATQNVPLTARALICASQSEVTVEQSRQMPVKAASTEESLMKKASLTVGLVALLFASGAKAGDITISPVTTATIGSGYLPKVAADNFQTAVSISETATGLSPLQNQTGVYTDVPPSLNWSGPYHPINNPTPQLGLSPSIALAYDGGSFYDNAVEVHQGGQKNDSSLWIQLGNSSTALSSGTSPTIDWSGTTLYDTGYNPTIAVDLNHPLGNTTTVVEVHQAGTDLSMLWYHVGTLTLGTAPSMSPSFGTPHQMFWYPGHGITAFYEGSVPTVSISNNVVVLVAQGPSGALWYAIGKVIGAGTLTPTINWLTPPISYDTATTGYNPTVSVFSPNAGARVVVEAHQENPGTSQLYYTTGRLTYSTTAGWSITWALKGETPFKDTGGNNVVGCYPSLALAGYSYTEPITASQMSLTETHETACGAATVDASFNFIVF
jgi:hypothetical protein